jgi:hypothetical protein
MSSDIHSVLVGETWRKAGLVAKASGSAITTGTVNYYLKCLTGANAGKWWKNSDQTWAATETANAMTHQADGNWTITLAASPFTDAVLYLEYAKEAGDLHVAAEGRLLRGKAVLDDVNASKIGGTSQTAYDFGENLNVVLARLGAWTTGHNIMTALRALARSDASESDLGGTFDPATDSMQAIRDAVYTGTPPTKEQIATQVEQQVISETDGNLVLKAITDKIAAVNPSLEGLTLAAIATQVRTELATELARIDAAITSRLAAAGYTPPNNEGIGTAATQATAAALAAAGLAEDVATLVEGLGSLTPGERNAIADALLDRANAIETGKTVRQAVRIIAAVLAGKVSGAGGGSETFKGLDGATGRVRVTVDSNGNRSSVTYDPAP